MANSRGRRQDACKRPHCDHTSRSTQNEGAVHISHTHTQLCNGLCKAHYAVLAHSHCATKQARAQAPCQGAKRPPTASHKVSPSRLHPHCSCVDTLFECIPSSTYLNGYSPIHKNCVAQHPVLLQRNKIPCLPSLPVPLNEPQSTARPACRMQGGSTLAAHTQQMSLVQLVLETRNTQTSRGCIYVRELYDAKQSTNVSKSAAHLPYTAPEAVIHHCNPSYLA